MTVENLDIFVDAYIECALWSSNDDEGKPLEESEAELSDEARAQAHGDCQAFIEANLTDLAGLDAQQAGRDFWLTRNGHGVGFWDRGLGELGTRLTDSAHAWGSCDLYIGDDGKIYMQ